MQNSQSPLDPQALNLAKAIAKTETGGHQDPYNARGASGEFGAYQFMPETYKTYARKYLGDEKAPADMANQNKIVYSFIKEKKDAGFNPSQIASMWNAGEGRPNAYKEGFKGTNAKGVSFDVPGYAMKVSNFYRELSGNTAQASSVPSYQPQPPREESPYGASFPATGEEGLLEGAAKAVGNIPSSAVNLGKNLFNVVQHPIKTIQGVANTAMGGVERGLGAVIGKEVDDERTQAFDAVVGALKDRYGSVDALKKTAINDPTGIALDLATILQGGGSAVLKGSTAMALKGTDLASDIGKLSKAERAATLAKAVSEGKLGTLPKLAQQTEAIGSKINPINIIGRGISSGLNKLGSKLTGVQNELEIQNLRMTPAQQMKYGARVPDVIDWAKKNGLDSGTPADRFAKATDIVENYENTLQNFLETNNTAKNIFVNKGDLVDQLVDLQKKLMRDSADAPLIQRQVQSAINNVIQQYRGQKIPISRLNQLKRSVTKNAYTKGGDKVLDWVEHDIGTLLKNAIEDATKGLEVSGMSIKEFNRMYGTAITAKKLLKTAATRPEIDFLGRGTGRITAAFLAEKFGGIPGAILAYLVEPKIAQWLGGTAARSTRGRISGATGRGLLNVGGGINRVTPMAGQTGLIGNLLDRATK